MAPFPDFEQPLNPFPRYAAMRDREPVFQDPDTGLLYLTDGNGAGLMVLRYTGPIPEKPPIPGGR